MNYQFPIYIIQGAQYGSEGKGQIAALYATKKSAVAAVRTGSINAGHTVFYKGVAYKMQQLPTAWVNDDPDCYLVLGPGAYVHPATLAREALMVSEALGRDITKQLVIDRRCALHSEDAEAAGHKSGRHEAMGATGKGSSNAVIERMLARGDPFTSPTMLFSHRPYAGGMDFSHCIANAVRFLHGSLTRGPIVLEGTQGAMLDFITGPYPYVTNRAVSSAAWLAYAGLSPMLDVRTILVARTFPIRVAGNSGPMPGEIGWTTMYRMLRALAAHDGGAHIPQISDMTLTAYEHHLADIIEAGGGPVKLPHYRWSEEDRIRHRQLLSDAPTAALRALPEEQQRELLQFFEQTTVTNKLRRISAFDEETVKEAIMMNGCHEMWLTFLNYRYPSLWASTSRADVGTVAGQWLQGLENDFGVPVVGVTTERYEENHLWVK